MSTVYVQGLQIQRLQNFILENKDKLDGSIDEAYENGTLRKDDLYNLPY